MKVLILSELVLESGKWGYVKAGEACKHSKQASPIRTVVDDYDT